jgi:drug/metabolite transporter (DMT)-like permease
MHNKLTSRKFWISVAAFLGSIAASVAGLTTGEKWITITGIICGMLSAAIYAAAEAYVDAAHADGVEDEKA